MDLFASVQGVDLKGECFFPDKMTAYVMNFWDDRREKFQLREELLKKFEELGIGWVECKLTGRGEEFKGSGKRRRELLIERCIGLTKWCGEMEQLRGLKRGYLMVGNEASVGLSSAAYWGTKIQAVVCLSGSPDLALEELDLVESPTLLIVEEYGTKEQARNKLAYQKLGCIKKMEVGVNEEKTVDLVLNWLKKYLLLI